MFVAFSATIWMHFLQSIFNEHERSLFAFHFFFFQKNNHFVYILWIRRNVRSCLVSTFVLRLLPITVMCSLVCFEMCQLNHGAPMTAIKYLNLLVVIVQWRKVEKLNFFFYYFLLLWFITDDRALATWIFFCYGTHTRDHIYWYQIATCVVSTKRNKCVVFVSLYAFGICQTNR